jgi:LPS O-antigen subunit length determinant protein (WzzB/FepE family)
MQDYKDSNFDDIDIGEVLYVLFQGKWVIASLTSIASIIAVIYSLYLPNIYQSQSLLTPVASSSSMSDSIGGYTSLAGLAGINLSSQSSESNSVQALSKIVSLSFFEKNILPNIFLPNLMAVKSYNPLTNDIEYDEEIYNENENIWVRDNLKKIPTPQESFFVFIKHISISQDIKTGFIRLSVKHQSPYLAKKWNDLLISQINIFYRQKDRIESEKAVSYLNQQIANTNLSEINAVMAELLKKEIQDLTLIEVRESYVFEYIDPPAVMENKAEPSRALISILGFILGLIISIIAVLVSYFRPK